MEGIGNSGGVGVWIFSGTTQLLLLLVVIIETLICYLKWDMVLCDLAGVF